MTPDEGAQRIQPDKPALTPEQAAATLALIRRRAERGVTWEPGSVPRHVSEATADAFHDRRFLLDLLDSARSDEVERLRWAQWIDQQSRRTDWACAECVEMDFGGSARAQENVVAGFRCVWHEARAALREADPPGRGSWDDYKDHFPAGKNVVEPSR